MKRQAPQRIAFLLLLAINSAACLEGTSLSDHQPESVPPPETPACPEMLESHEAVTFSSEIDERIKADEARADLNDWTAGNQAAAASAIEIQSNGTYEWTGTGWVTDGTASGAKVILQFPDGSQVTKQKFNYPSEPTTFVTLESAAGWNAFGYFHQAPGYFDTKHFSLGSWAYTFERAEDNRTIEEMAPYGERKDSRYINKPRFYTLALHTNARDVAVSRTTDMQNFPSALSESVRVVIDGDLRYEAAGPVTQTCDLTTVTELFRPVKEELAIPLFFVCQENECTLP